MKKIGIWVGGIVFALIGISSLSSPASPTPSPSPASLSTEVVTEPVTPTATTIAAPTSTPVLQPTFTPAPQSISTPNSYINTSGDKIQSPTYYDSAPAGASALCNDGTYSFSASRSGTCSHHGGVADWL